MIEKVNHPKHYNSHPSGVECIAVAEHMNFNLGNVMKYLWRESHKGTSLKDLEKAAWYLDREITRRQQMAISDAATLADFAQELNNHLQSDE